MSTKIALLPGEQVVMSSDNNILTLTTKRIRYDSALLGSYNLISITLDSVASCGLVTRSFPILLLLAALALIVAFSQHDEIQSIFFVATIVLVAAYFFTRQSVISIASNGGQSITVPSKGLSRNSIIEFLEAVESEKLKVVEQKVK
jgi:hypothetical protein